MLQQIFDLYCDICLINLSDVQLTERQVQPSQVCCMIMQDSQTLAKMQTSVALI